MPENDYQTDSERMCSKSTPRSRRTLIGTRRPTAGFSSGGQTTTALDASHKHMKSKSGRPQSRLPKANAGETPFEKAAANRRSGGRLMYDLWPCWGVLLDQRNWNAYKSEKPAEIFPR